MFPQTVGNVFIPRDLNFLCCSIDFAFLHVEVSQHIVAPSYFAASQCCNVVFMTAFNSLKHVAAGGEIMFSTSFFPSFL